MVNCKETKNARSAECRLKEAQELTLLAAAEAACVKSFTGRWKNIRTTLELLSLHINKLAEFAFYKDNSLSKELLESIVSSLEEALHAAKFCTDLTYGGKLQMQSNIDALTMKLSLHLRDCQLLINSGMLKENSPFFSKPSAGAGKEALKCIAKNLLARLQIGSTESKLKALDALIDIMNEDDKNIFIIAAQEGAYSLILLLDASVPAMREKAAVAFCCLASIDYCEHQIEMEGALAPLVRLLESGSSLANEKASATLQSLTHTPDFARSVVSHGGIFSLLATCRGGTPLAQAAAAGALRNLSGISESRESMIEEGAIPTILHVLSCGTTDAQEHAAATLQNLSHNNENITRIIASEGGIISILRFLDIEDVILGHEAAIEVLQNMTAFVGNFAALLSAGIVQHLPRLLTSYSLSVQQTAAVIVGDLALTPDTIKLIGEAGCIPPLLKMLDAKTRIAQEHAVCALATLLSFDKNQRIFLAQEKGISRIVQLLDPLYELAARESAVSALTILAGRSKCRKQMVCNGVFYSLERLAETDLPAAKKLLERLERGRLHKLLKKLDLSDW